MAIQESTKVSFPKAFHRWTDWVFAREGYGSVSEYVRQLVRPHLGEGVFRESDRQLIAAMESGLPTALAGADRAQVR